jgi:hypothetical protein
MFVCAHVCVGGRGVCTCMSVCAGEGVGVGEGVCVGVHVCVCVCVLTCEGIIEYTRKSIILAFKLNFAKYYLISQHHSSLIHK